MVPMLMQTAQSSVDVLTIVKEVHDFYNDSWNSLLWSFGIMGGILIFFLGVVLPWWSERSRRESFRLDKEAILQQIADARQEATRLIQEATSLYKENLQQALEKASAAEQETIKKIADTASTMWIALAFSAADKLWAARYAAWGICEALNGYKTGYQLSAGLGIISLAIKDPTIAAKIAEDTALFELLKMRVSRLTKEKLTDKDKVALGQIADFVAKAPGATGGPPASVPKVS